MKGYDKVKELVEGELIDYSFFELKEIEKTETYKDDEYFRVEIKTGYGENTKYLSFKYNSKEDQLYIDMSEDSWNEIDDFSTSIKYFWMALLKW